MDPTTTTAPVHADAGQSERDAAKRAAKFAESLEGRVLSLAIRVGTDGITAEEARELLGLPIERQYSVSPRLSALKRRGLLETGGAKRGRFQVYVATSATEVAA